MATEDDYEWFCLLWPMIGKAMSLEKAGTWMGVKVKFRPISAMEDVCTCRHSPDDCQVHNGDSK